jgi:hypothetical protein
MEMVFFRKVYRVIPSGSDFSLSKSSLSQAGLLVSGGAPWKGSEGPQGTGEKVGGGCRLSGAGQWRGRRNVLHETTKSMRVNNFIDKG